MAESMNIKYWTYIGLAIQIRIISVDGQTKDIVYSEVFQAVKRIMLVAIN